MATIECCETLSGSIKAKLQDAGFLYLADITFLLRPDSGLSSDARVSSIQATLKQRLTQRIAALKEAEEKDSLATYPNSSNGTSTGLAADPLAPTPIEQVAFFTEDEIAELVHALQQNACLDFHKSRADVASSEGVQHVNMDTQTLTNSEHARNNNGVLTAVRVPGCRALREILADAHQRQRNGQPAHVTTFSRTLDALLGGGVPVGGVTEVSGPPGVGKTQLLMQLAVSCAMPVEFGGLGGSCIFVDTEGSFVAERLEQMATAAVSLMKTILAKDAQQQPEKRVEISEQSQSNDTALRTAAIRKRARADEENAEDIIGEEDRYSRTRSVLSLSENEKRILLSAQTNSEGHRQPTWKRDAMADFSVESILERVHYVRLTDLTEFLAFVYSLPAWLSSSQQVMPPTRSDDGGHHSESDRKDSYMKHDRNLPRPFRMVLIDSVALPFRASDAFEKNTLTPDDVNSSPTYSSSSAFSAAKLASAGSLSKQGLWQRSRLLYQCSTALEQLASSHALAVIVSNHMTTKLLRAAPFSPHRASGGATVSEDDKSGASGRQTVLIPALGDAWGHGLSTRLLLAYHHYELPACAFEAEAHGGLPKTTRACLEDVVYNTLPPGTEPAAATAVTRVVQHRVARLLKGSALPRREVCFLVTSKGIRDVRTDMVRRWVTQQAPPPQ